jgi:peptidoglycan/LPS O-acetylase OafA/YrhL
LQPSGERAKYIYSSRSPKIANDRSPYHTLSSYSEIDYGIACYRPQSMKPKTRDNLIYVSVALLAAVGVAVPIFNAVIHDREIPEFPRFKVWLIASSLLIAWWPFKDRRRFNIGAGATACWMVAAIIFNLACNLILNHLNPNCSLILQSALFGVESALFFLLMEATASSKKSQPR